MKSVDKPKSNQVVCLSAITLLTSNMSVAVQFYQSLGFVVHGGEQALFNTLVSGSAVLNLKLDMARAESKSSVNTSGVESNLGRIIFHVDDVDVFYARVIAVDLIPDAEPTDAAWGERYFHLSDPDGNGLSFATPLER